MLLLDGKKVSEAYRKNLADKIRELKSSPGLAVVLVGDDPASQIYVKNKAESCLKVGIQSWVHRCDKNIRAENLKSKIDELNSNKEVSAILVQLPLPDHLNEKEVLSWIDPKKDADCLTVQNQGLFYNDQPIVSPCTPAGVMEILKFYNIEIEGQRAAVIGRSSIVGQPMFHLLQKANATVTLCHSKTKDMRGILKQCDIVVVAAGIPAFLGPEDFSPNAVVIDVGIHRTEKGLCGDVQFDEVKDHVKAITPVPKGVGPMTITMLLENTYQLSRHQ